jgi:4-amino-4-deoxy-L-arabinose transferase-like glycosyltransferase
VAVASVDFQSEQLSRRTTAFLVVVVLLLTLVPRLVGICSGPIHADEKHWDRRSHKILQNITKDPRRVTSHLGHPGVVPALVMAAGQGIAVEYNSLIGAQPSDQRFLDSISGARIANAIFSSLLPVILLLALLSWTGPAEALCISLVVALSPRFIDLSRIAHVDTAQAVVVCGTVFLYVRSLLGSERRWKFLAGIGFGLCLLCKPTSIALIPGLFVVKVLLARLWPQQFLQRGLSWSDVWLALTAMVVFVLLYSRMWNHGGAFIEWKDVSHAGPHQVYLLAQRLGSGIVGIVSCLAVSGVLVWLGLSARGRSSQPWYWHGAAVVGLLFLSFILFPAVWENIVRYWMRVFNLTSVKHQSFAGPTAPPEGGYFTSMAVELHPLVLCGALLSPLLLLRPLRASLKACEQQLILFSSVIFIAWMMLLAPSAKQAYRYSMPAVPFLFVVACFLLFAAGRVAGRRVIPIVVLGAAQAFSALSAYPVWDLYESASARFVSEAARLEALRPRSAQGEVLAFLRAESVKRGRTLLVTVLGDGDVMSREAARSTSASSDSENHASLRFGYFPDYAADFILVQDYLKQENSQWSRHLQQTPRFRYASRGLALVSVYEVDPAINDREVVIPVDRLRVLPGTRGALDGHPVVTLTPERTKAGYGAAVPGGFSAAAGRYEISFIASTEASGFAGVADSVPVARFEATKSCSRVILAGEARAGLGKAVLNCELPEPRRMNLHVYWFGKVPLQLGEIAVSRKDG